jgi:hypothetical protein
LLHPRWELDVRIHDTTRLLHASNDTRLNTYGEAKLAHAVRINGKGDENVHLVHASPGAFGSGTPEMAWMRDDLPELCEPIMAMIGRSMSRSSLLVVSQMNHG